VHFQSTNYAIQFNVHAALV